MMRIRCKEESKGENEENYKVDRKKCFYVKMHPRSIGMCRVVKEALYGDCRKDTVTVF